MALFLLLSTPPAPHSKDIWSSSAPTWDRSPDLKNKVTVTNSKPSWERRQWLRGSPGHPGSSHGPVKGGQRRGEAREGYGLTLGKAGTGTSPFCVGGLEIRSAAAHGLRDPEMTQRPDAHPGSDRSRRALSWRSSVGSESLCFFCPHGRLLDKSQVHTLGSWEGLKSPYHPLPSSSPLTLSLLGCLVHHWPHHQQGTFPEHLLGSVCSGHGHLAPQMGQCKQLT